MTSPAEQPQRTAIVTGEDIAHAVIYLTSDQVHMIHGITLYVDGGITATRMN